jgi:alpha-L-fucosidase
MPSGELHPDDIKNMAEFGSIIQKTFATNLAAGAKIKASNTRGKSALFAADKLIDHNRYSYWATDDSVHSAELLFQLKAKQKFNVIRLRENIKLGQRIEAVAVDAWIDNNWKEIAKATSIGGNRLIRLSGAIETNQVRLRILQSPVCIALSDFGLFAEPNLK